MLFSLSMRYSHQINVVDLIMHRAIKIDRDVLNTSIYSSIRTSAENSIDIRTASDI